MEAALWGLGGFLSGAVTCALFLTHFAGRAARGAGEAAVESAREDLIGAMRDNGGEVVNLVTDGFQRTMDAAASNLELRHQQFRELVEPLATAHSELKPRLELLDRQVNAVSVEAGKLAHALSNARSVGQWGEIQLRRVVELAGMKEHCDFFEQAAIKGSALRPDMVIRLPGNRSVVVDAKASTTAFLESRTLEDPELAKKALFRHARMMRRQIDELAARDYGRLVPDSVDFAVMFVPGDQLLSTALDVMPSLVEHGMAKRVAVATPASLIALLWTVAHGWQQRNASQKVQVMRDLGRELRDEAAAFAKTFDELRAAMAHAVNAYNHCAGLLRRGMFDKAESIGEMATGRRQGIGVQKLKNPRSG